MNNPILLSTGWMFPASNTRSELQQMHSNYASLVDGYELHPTSEERVETYGELDLPEDFEYTIHSSPTQHPDEIRTLLNSTEPRSVVYHPTNQLNGSVVSQLGSSVPSVENLDSEYGESETLKQLHEYIGYFGFTLDVQHAYEHDPTMEYGLRLLDEYGSHLTQLHVSGGTETQKHALLHQADNQKKVSALVVLACERYPNLPLVIEGEYESFDEVEKEVEWLEVLKQKARENVKEQNE